MLRALVIFSLVSLASADLPKRTCTRNNAVYQPGERIILNLCHFCICAVSNMVMCTPSTCLSNFDNFCVVGISVYTIGKMFTRDCNVCFCIRPDYVVCTRKSCETPKISAGDNATCYCNGTKYNVRESFTRDNAVCTCAGVNAFVCRYFHWKGYPPQGVERDICHPNGKLYKPTGGMKKHCKKCASGNRRVTACEDINCFPSSGTERVSFNDSCYYKGKLYKKGEDFLDYCNTCTCIENNRVDCDEVACGLNTRVFGPDCEYKGHSYNRGNTFFDGCNECYCPIVGDVNCLTRSCPSYKRLLRIEDSCAYDGFFISKDQHFIDDDCQSCKCVGNDHFICRKRTCNTYFHLDVDDHGNLIGYCHSIGRATNIFQKHQNRAGNITNVQKRVLLMV